MVAPLEYLMKKLYNTCTIIKRGGNIGSPHTLCPRLNSRVVL